ncbi:PrsW family intramembrane metalloprotease [Sporocytophaga myxococcoides]|uniref:PrsW family intramembrane metalloprotease n=1 Tax=Sporocytophaga myxococcoides TaxID=153721 RepID=UPI0003FBD297|nr:PrsW family intramembrane metalloprotease [Sporocytophaga myxococcoides]
MNFKKIITFITLCFWPFLLFAEGKKTFFVGRSLYFWVLLGGGVYIFYLYHINKNEKKEFFKIPFVRSLSLSLILLLFSFFAINFFIKEPDLIKSPTEAFDEEYLPVKDLNQKEDLYIRKLEISFSDPDLNFECIQNHFRIPQSWEENNRYYERDDYTLLNFFSDRLNFSDSAYVDQARLSIGLYKYFSDSLPSAISYFNSVSNRNLPYLNYYLAVTYLKIGDTLEAKKVFSKAIQINDVFYNAAFEEYTQLLEKYNDEEGVKKLLYTAKTEKFVPFQMATKFYFLNGDYFKYYLKVLSHSFKDFKWTGFLAALGIMLVWLFYIIRIDIYEKEDWFPLLLTLLYGMTFTFLAFFFYDFFRYYLSFDRTGSFWNDLLYCIFGIGAIEELVKIIPLFLLVAFFSEHLNEAYDYILYACLSALGFAFVENILYFDGDLAGIVQGRGMTSVPSHMIASSIVAYGFVLSKYRFKNFPLWISFPVFFLLGSITHGLYDFWIFKQVFPVFLLHFVISVSVWIIIINNCMNNSPYFNYKMKYRSENMQTYMAVSLTTIFVLQYALVAWEKGPSIAGHSLTTAFIIGGIFTVYYTDKLTNMDLVKGYWNTISVHSVTDKRRNNAFNLRLFFVRLISGDIIPHHFVGDKVSLSCEKNNLKLLTHFPHPINGEIIDRLVVTCKVPGTGNLFKDPYWFKLITEESISPGADPETIFLFRFSDDQPTFTENKPLLIHLYCFRNHHVKDDLLQKEDLRSLGKAMLRLRSVE